MIAEFIFNYYLDFSKCSMLQKPRAGKNSGKGKMLQYSVLSESR